MNPKLVLFDIDGTLVEHIYSGPRHAGFLRFEYATEKVFGLKIIYDGSINYNGWVDRAIAWENIKRYGVTKPEFDRLFPKLADALHEKAKIQAEERQLYQAIPSCVALVKLLMSDRKRFRVGLLTGNVETVGRWKLHHAGISVEFDFGLFGDKADDRIMLAGTVFDRAATHFGIRFAPADITVVGDAPGDIRCGQAIGASTVIAMTGRHTPKEELAALRPTLLVETLEDPVVYGFFGI